MLALLFERIVEIRAKDTWRNVAARLASIKVVEYDLGEARVQQTTELKPDVAKLLGQLRVAPPPRIHSITPLEGSSVPAET